MKKINLWIYILGLLLASLLAGSKALDHFGEEYTDQALKRALISFAVARTLNGLISVAQEAEVAMQPAGLGVNVSPGEILDPINDLVERFSMVMLIAASAIGVQKLLLSMSAWDVFNYLVIGFWLLYGVMLIAKRNSSKGLHPMWYKTVIFLILVRFATPVMALTNEGLYNLFLAPNYQEANQELEGVSQTIESNTSEQEADIQQQQSAYEGAKDWLGKAISQLDIKKQIKAYQDAAERASKNVIELITVFVVQTVLFPIFFLWLIFRSGRSLLITRSQSYAHPDLKLNHRS
ncbi:hypothetical protein [Kangiella koreensis]|uniref:Uncharacterized protein n=1 Tax=Kangiella koreensis (strain DSM 16069 / JCM 12317 / KCTC 12182 / SW-125) TaxID=523791 RepID=C7R957_KANKD|nr:hypothetical protein [Kangiella koreensis]ACV27847.1 conserved hypothetical protein [Kangiella koreensis DSM 16069]